MPISSRRESEDEVSVRTRSSRHKTQPNRGPRTTNQAPNCNRLGIITVRHQHSGLDQHLQPSVSTERHQQSSVVSETSWFRLTDLVLHNAPMSVKGVVPGVAQRTNVRERCRALHSCWASAGPNVGPERCSVMDRAFYSCSVLFPEAVVCS